MALTAKSTNMFGMPDIDLNPFDEEYEKEGEAAWLFNPKEIRTIFK